MACSFKRTVSSDAEVELIDCCTSLGQMICGFEPSLSKAIASPRAKYLGGILLLIYFWTALSQSFSSPVLLDSCPID